MRAPRARIEPLIPQTKKPRKNHPGRKPLGKREVLTRIFFALRTGIPWRKKFHQSSAAGLESHVYED
ncbi:MAG: transposase [Bdellovibrio sp.]